MSKTKTNKPDFSLLQEKVVGTQFTAAEWLDKMEPILKNRGAEVLEFGARMCFSTKFIPPWSHWDPSFKQAFLAEVEKFWGDRPRVAGLMHALGAASFVQGYEEFRMIKALSQMIGMIVFNRVLIKHFDLYLEELNAKIQREADERAAQATKPSGQPGAPLDTDALPQQSSN